MTHCSYCGTGLSEEDPDVEEATGSRHYAATCREYVFQVKQHAKAEAATLRSQLADAIQERDEARAQLLHSEEGWRFANDRAEAAEKREAALRAALERILERGEPLSAAIAQDAIRPLTIVLANKGGT